MKYANKKWILNILLLCGSTLLTVGGVEAVLRMTHQYETFNAATELPWMRNNSQDLSQFFTVDPDFGFRPILGTEGYTEYGTLPNDYPIKKRSGITRLLFIGDSVTVRGKIIGAIKQTYGDETFEYWNAGVESFNTIQEVRFYQRYNASIHSDHVILTFHVNDFEPTPVAFFSKENKLVVYIPHKPLTYVNRWFFEKSYLYRWIIGRTLDPQKGGQEIATEIFEHLRLLRDSLARDDIRLSVLVLPILKPYEQWSAQQRAARNVVLSMLQTLQISHYDLLEPFQEAMVQGVSVQESPGDTWHPSFAVAQVFAKYLASRQFLEQKVVH